MVTLKKSLQLFLTIMFASVSFASYAAVDVAPAQDSTQIAVASTSEQPASTEEHGAQTEAEFVQSYIEHHLKDDYYFTFFSDRETGRHYGFPLPVILFDNGMHVFSAAEFEHGEKLVEKGGQTYKLYHSKIYKTAADGVIHYDADQRITNEKPWDFSITKNVASLLFTTALLFIMFIGLAKTYKSGPNNLPKGFARALEPLVIYVRDEMARPNIGDKKYKQFMPFLLSVFFLIFLLNIFGLTPLGFNVTGSISVTVCLALFTFLYTNLSANKDYWKHIFWMPGVPWPMKIVLAPIEVLGMFTKPFSLLIRLFANITAGHSVVFGLIAVGFVMKEALGTPTAVGIGFFLSTFLVLLEILVAFLQAFIFTMLSSLFIGSAVQEHDHH